MKLIDNFVSKVGTDKLLHFLVGNFITSCITFIVLIQDALVGIETLLAIIPGAIIAIFLAIIKEKLDNIFDKKDVIATLLGVLSVVVFVLIGIIFNVLSK